MKPVKWLCVVLFLGVLSAQPCKAEEPPGGDTADSAAEQDWTKFEANGELEVWDPIEPFNRGMFWFNDKLYFYLFKPVARGYRAVVPEPARVAVNNVFTNLGAPVRVVNSFLQGKPKNGLDELAKFAANTIFGLGGIFDLCSDMDPQPTREDFGQTLGVYGVGSGFYLVLPVFGPSSLRDAPALFADFLVEPIPSPFYLKMHPLEVLGLGAYQRINWLSIDKNTYEWIKKNNLDPYLFVRNAYLQKRAAEIEK